MRGRARASKSARSPSSEPQSITLLGVAGWRRRHGDSPGGWLFSGQRCAKIVFAGNG
jgi:hypothetical protein